MPAPALPQQLGTIYSITAANSTPSLATDGFALNNHRFINVWLSQNASINLATSSVTATFWLYKTGIGWIRYTDIEPIRTYGFSSQVGFVTSLEPRGSVDRVYIQLSNFVEVQNIQILVEGVTYDSSDNCEPERLLTETGYTIALVSPGPPIADNPPVGVFDTKGHRFLNIWTSYVNTSAAPLPTQPYSNFTYSVFLYKPVLGWIGNRDAGVVNLRQNSTSLTDRQGTIQQIETRGATRVLIYITAMTTIKADIYVDGVTYG